VVAAKHAAQAGGQGAALTRDVRASLQRVQVRLSTREQAHLRPRCECLIGRRTRAQQAHRMDGCCHDHATEATIFSAGTKMPGAQQACHAPCSLRSRRACRPSSAPVPVAIATDRDTT